MAFLSSLNLRLSFTTENGLRKPFQRLKENQRLKYFLDLAGPQSLLTLVKHMNSVHPCSLIASQCLVLFVDDEIIISESTIWK